MVGPLENGAVRPGTTLETALRLTEESAVIPTRANGTATDSRNASIDVVEATATLDGVSPNGTLDLPVNASIGVRGTTTVAPGTTATVHLRGRNDTFVYEKQTTVSEDGTYEADLDVSDRKDGETYTVSVTADGEQLSRVRTGEFVGGTADEAAVSQGGGGGGYGLDHGADAETVSDRPEEPTATASPTTDAPPPVPIPEVSSNALSRSWNRLTEPMVLGVPSLVVIAFGGLAVLVISYGLKRLLEP